MDCVENYSMTTQEDGSIKVTFRPNYIADRLQGRLSPQDINIGMDIINKSIATSQIQRELFSGCVNTGCKLCQQSPFRVFPNGNTNADVMFINTRATEYETFMCMSHCDVASVFLSLILSKMNVSRDSVYCTTLEKCPTCAKVQDECNICREFYLAREVELVKPKVIICNGLSLLQKLKASGMIEGLPGNEGYGTIYNVVVRTNIQNSPGTIETKIIAIYELNKVLQKGEGEYEQCKNALWSQLLTAFKATVGG